MRYVRPGLVALEPGPLHREGTEHADLCPHRQGKDCDSAHDGLCVICSQLARRDTGRGRRRSPPTRPPAASTERRETMRLFILGATGRTGAELVDQALARGHAVTAFVRAPQ